MRRALRVAGVAAVLGLLASRSDGAWLRIDTPNFVIVGDVGAGRLRDVARLSKDFETF